ncbi:multidrug ABC transporter ATP-binding protein [Plantactinospora endophytica]|uniref:Multidrug ABC transporter ATP-binding protein n=1 Tax=Plantactinospora endophytica TaxID=673535 RepID=A0ABQ4E6Q4_9ACTN|nr:multidrug ABC transporter ATP-binding protein [Plantactinospora endophytica]
MNGGAGRTPGNRNGRRSVATPVERSISFGPTARRLLRGLRPYRLRLLVVLGFGVAGVVCAVVLPTLLGRATDVVFSGAVGASLPAGQTEAEAVAALRASGAENRAAMLERMDVLPGAGIDFAELGRVLALAVVVALLAGLFQWGQVRVLTGVVNRHVRLLRSEVAEKLHRIPLGYLDQHRRGDLLSRATNDVENVAQTLQQALGQLLTAVLTLVGVVAAMLLLSPLLAVVALLAVPLSLLVTRQIAKRSQRQFAAQWAVTGSLNAHVEEAYTGHELVTAFGRRHEMAETFATHNDGLYRASFRAQFMSSMIVPATMFIGNLGYVAVAVVGGFRILSGAMTLGDVQAFVHYCRQFTQPLSQVASIANLVQSGVASAERVFALLDAPEQEPEPDAPPPAPFRGRVTFEQVSFRYQPDEPLIEDLSLDVAPGSTVAVVGHSGAGKTTLVNLLMRFYEVDSGRIRLDGVDLTTMRRADLRSRIGMVLQDAWLFDGTIRDNIRYARPHATDQEVRAAARAARVDRFVHSLPAGYDTVIDVDNGTVSAGQRQLITIARAFLADPQLLILDEATSSVDSRTEMLVQEAMAELRAGRTSFVIAHRLSTIRDADLIVVIAHGRIVEQGDHATLLAAGGPYRELYDAQFARPVVDLGDVPADGPARMTQV